MLLWKFECKLQKVYSPPISVVDAGTYEEVLRWGLSLSIVASLVAVRAFPLFVTAG
jgi:hypothetical protein